MDRRAAWQGSPRHLGGGIGQGMRVAEGHDPLIVHHQEIENRPEELCIFGASPQIARTGASCVKEAAEQLVIRRQPAEHLKGKDMSGVLLHSWAFLLRRRLVLAAI